MAIWLVNARQAQRLLTHVSVRGLALHASDDDFVFTGGCNICVRINWPGMYRQLFPFSLAYGDVIDSVSWESSSCKWRRLCRLGCHPVVACLMCTVWLLLEQLLQLLMCLWDANLCYFV
jgi:hypothetical protein